MKKEEFLSLSKAFRERMQVEIETLPEDEWGSDWMSTDAIATCHTEGCSASEMHLRVSVAEPLDGVYKVLCGMCSRAIHDVDPMFEDDEDFRLPTRYPDGNSWVVET